MYEGVRITWPVLYLVHRDDEGAIRTTRVEAILEYFADHSSLSYEWMKRLARGFGLLVDHSMAVLYSPLLEQWKATGELERRLLRGFAHALLLGTIRLESGRAEDWTGLYWRPLGKRQAGKLLSSVTMFFRWLGDKPSTAAWFSATSTEHVAKQPAVAMRLASELLMRRETALLGHLEVTRRAPSHAFPGIVGPSFSGTGAVPTFPARYVGPMLYRAFVDRNGETDETAQLIAHLMFLFGLRKSEGFHLYTTDVQFVRDVPWIFFHHPEEGMIRGLNGGLITRREYLQKFDLLPRNRDEGRNKAGWKGMQDELQGTPGYSLPIDVLRARTVKLLKRYIFVTRPALMARRSRSLHDHPFLFVSSGRTADSSGGQVGDPYTMSAFEGAWERAVKNIGRMFDDPTMTKPQKYRGTTPHGFRHFFGRFLFTAGVEGSVIQRCMHHKSLNSHRFYTRLSPSEVNQIVQDANRTTVRKGVFQDLHDDFLSHLHDAPSAPLGAEREDE